MDRRSTAESTPGGGAPLCIVVHAALFGGVPRLYALSGERARRAIEELAALDADFALTWFSSKNTSNRHLNDPEFDRLYEASKIEMDVEKRRSLLQQAIARLHEEAPYLYIVDGAQVDGFSAKRIKGAEMWVEGDQRLDKIEMIS